MSIVRVEHSKERPYVVLNKLALEDKNISWAAKGLWAYLLSRPDNWKVSVAQLSSIFNGKGGKEKAIYALLKELIFHGYCIKEVKRGEKGHYDKVEYIIYELKKSSPLASQGDAGKRNAGNRHLNKEGSVISNENDDDDRMRGADEKGLEKVHKKKGIDEIDLDIEKTNTKGQVIKVTQSEIFRHFVGKTYSTDVIRQAIKRTQSASGSINDILKYISSVCIEIVRQNSKESVSKKPKGLTKVQLDPSISPSSESKKRLEQEKKEWVTWESYTNNQNT